MIVSESKPVAIVKIKYLREYGEYVCRAYAADGSRLENADCYETDKRAAEDTRAAMLAHGAQQLAAE